MDGRKAPAQGTALIFSAVLLVSTAIAFNASLKSILLTYSSEEFGSFAGFVPLMALIVAYFFFYREYEVKRDANGTLIGLGAFFLVLAIHSLVSSFQALRLDLLALPIFIIGATALLFGANTLARLKFPLIYLFLAWPAIYFPLLALEGALTNITADASYAVVKTLGADITREAGNVFISANGRIPVEIVPLCAGMNALVGFIVLVLPFALLFRGDWKRRAAWLLGGVALVWLLNIARLSALVALWHWQGEAAALSFFHTFAGMLIFNGVLLLMLLLSPFFGIVLAIERRRMPFAGVPAALALIPKLPAGTIAMLLLLLLFSALLGMANSAALS